MPQRIFKDSDYEKFDNGQQMIPTRHRHNAGDSARMAFTHMGTEELAPGCSQCGHPFIYKNEERDKWMCEACGHTSFGHILGAYWKPIALFVFKYQEE